jgi:hypothetical protein
LGVTSLSDSGWSTALGVVDWPCLQHGRSQWFGGLT